MSGIYAGPARPSGAELQKAEDRTRAALSSGDERAFAARCSELNATHAARVMPGLGLMDVEAELAGLGMDPGQWYAGDDPEAGQ